MSETAPEAPATEMKPVTEPVGEEAVKAAEEAALVSVSSTIYSGIAFAILVVFVVGAAVPWLHRDWSAAGVTSTQDVSLWGWTSTDSTGFSTSTKAIDITCEDERQYFRGAEAFAIISIFVALGAFLFGLVARVRGTSVQAGGAVFAVLSFAASIVCWGIGVRTYYLSFCNAPSFRDMHFDIRAGAALFITGWALSVVNLIVAVKDIKVPKVLPDAFVDKFVGLLFTLAAFASLVFTVIGTPIPVFSQWTSSVDETRITIWSYKQYSNGIVVNSMDLKDSTCGRVPKYAMFSEAFAIISIGLSLVAVVVGAASTAGKGGKKSLIIVGLFTAVAALVKFAADLALYYKTFCSTQASLDQQKYAFNAGFALFVAASVAMFIATILAIVTAIAQHSANAPADGHSGASAFLFIFGTAISVTFTVIALTQPVFADEENNSYTRVGYWKVQTKSGAGLMEMEFDCQEWWERLVGAGSLGIIAIGLSVVAVLLGIAQLSAGSLRKAASFVGLFVSLEQLAAWALVVAVYWGNWCGHTPYNSNFNFGAGLGLMVAAWAVNVVVSVLNLVW